MISLKEGKKKKKKKPKKPKSTEPDLLDVNIFKEYEERIQMLKEQGLTEDDWLKNRKIVDLHEDKYIMSDEEKEERRRRKKERKEMDNIK